MKKIILFASIYFSLSILFAQNFTEMFSQASQDEVEQDENPSLNPKTGFPEIVNKPYVMFNEGVSVAQITRIQNMEKYNTGNFVWQDYLVGPYFEVQTGNMKPLNSIFRVAAYYPFYHTFNGMKQIPKQVLLYGGDLYYGVLFQTDMWKYIRLNFALGPHFNYELSDEYHHIEIGAGMLLGTELPVSKRWTVLFNGFASYDFGNFGTNYNICNYDYVWEYQLELGVRYSKKGINKYSYINSKPKEK